MGWHGLRTLEVTWRVIRLIAVPAALFALFIVILRSHALSVGVLVCIIVASAAGAFVCRHRHWHIPSVILCALSLVTFAAMVWWPVEKLTAQAPLLLPIIWGALLFLPIFALVEYERSMLNVTPQSRLAGFPYKGLDTEGLCKLARTTDDPALSQAAYALVWKGIADAPYKKVRSILRQLATEAADEDVRKQALERLTYPLDQDVLKREVGKDPAYRHYRWSYGWPHTHAFRKTKTEVKTTNGGTKLERCKYRCKCGMVKTETWRHRSVATLGCPRCGGNVVYAPTSDSQDKNVYVCEQCGARADHDFSAEHEHLESVLIRTDYHMSS